MIGGCAFSIQHGSINALQNVQTTVLKNEKITEVLPQFQVLFYSLSNDAEDANSAVTVGNLNYEASSLFEHTFPDVYDHSRLAFLG